MPTIKITAYLEVEDREVDHGPHGPLTAEAHEEYIDPLTVKYGFMDVRAELVEG